MGTTNNAQTTPIENLINEYVKFKQKEIKNKNGNKTNTAQTYGDNVPIVFKKGEFLSQSEKNFLDLLPKLLKEKRNTEIGNLIQLINYSVILFDWGNNLKSYKTYILHFLNYIKKILRSKKLEDIIRKIGNVEQLSDAENKQLEEDLTQRIVFSHEGLFTKFKSRLRSQERTSGDKIWLPLDYIAKIYRHNNNHQKNDFTTWLEEMTKGIYIHYMNEKDEIESIQFNKNISLEFKKKEDEKGYYYVFVIWGKKSHPVYTPTGVGNKKERMSVKSISEIDIDHVKPIDLTLRELGEKGKLNTLKIVSNSYRDLIYNDKDINTQIDELIKDENFNIDNLTKELNRIKRDSVLRLMDSKYNENKSNGLTYEKILQQKDGTYIGILGHIDEDDKGIPLTIYQRLKDKDCKIRATTIEIEGQGVTNYKDIINFI